MTEKKKKWLEMFPSEKLVRCCEVILKQVKGHIPWTCESIAILAVKLYDEYEHGDKWECSEKDE